jgi:large subunit ribosomal protein L4
MQVAVKNLDNKDIGNVTLSDTIFGEEYRADILHRVIQWQLAKRRSGCHKTKQRAEVAFSTRKIYKQKGTGRARHGSRKAPIFVGGGTVFGPHVRSHAVSLNKKIRLLGLKVALSLKLKENSIIILDSLKLKSAKTIDMKKKLKNFDAKSFLMVDTEVDANLRMSIANMHNVDVLPVMGMNVYDILRHTNLMLTTDAIKAIEARLV